MQQEMDSVWRWIVYTVMFYRLWDRILSHKISCSVPFTVTLRSPAFEQLEGRKHFIQYIALVLGEVYRKIMFGYRLSLEYNSSVLLDPYSCKIWLRLLWNSMNWIQFGSSVESPLSCGPKAIFLNLCFQKHVACGISQTVSWTDSAKLTLCFITLNQRGVSLPKRWGVVSCRSQ